MENNISVNLENLSEKEREQLMKLIKKSNNPKSKILKMFQIFLFGALIQSLKYSN